MQHTDSTQADGLRADLHVHTCASDSRWTPEQVVAGCREASIGLLAIADHDTIDSVRAAEASALANGVAFLPAVEVSARTRVRASGSDLLLHILAYGADPGNADLRELLAENRRRAKVVQVANIQHLKTLGYPVNRDEFEAYTYERTRGGFETLNYLMDKGIVADLQEWKRNIAPQMAQRMDGSVRPDRAIAAICAAGGVPVLAHAGASLKPAGGITDENLTWLIDKGIEGFECYSQYHNVATTQALLTFCAAHDLAVTGGSDFHGGFVNRQLGRPQVTTGMLTLKGIAERISYPAAAAEVATD